MRMAESPTEGAVFLTLPKMEMLIGNSMLCLALLAWNW